MSAIIIFLVGVGIVVSYNPSGTGGTPSIMGHSIDEIEGLKNIADQIPLRQKRVSGTCLAGNSIRTIKEDGTVECEDDTDTDTHGTLSCVQQDGNCPAGYIKVFCGDVQYPDSSSSRTQCGCCKVI